MTVRAPYDLSSMHKEESYGLDYFSVDLYDRSVIVDIMERSYYLCEDRRCGFPYAGSFNIELYGSHRLERTGDTSTQKYKIQWISPKFNYRVPQDVTPLKGKDAVDYDTYYESEIQKKNRVNNYQRFDGR